MGEEQEEWKSQKKRKSGDELGRNKRTITTRIKLQREDAKSGQHEGSDEGSDRRASELSAFSIAFKHGRN
jgi:hypothetical protein